MNRPCGFGRPIHCSGSTRLALFIQHPRSDAHAVQRSRHKPQGSGVKQRIGIHRCLQHTGNRDLQCTGMTHRVIKRKVCLCAVSYPCLGRNHHSTGCSIRPSLDLCQRCRCVRSFGCREVGTARGNASLPCGLPHLSCELCTGRRQIKLNLMDRLGHCFDRPTLGVHIRLTVSVHHLVQQGHIHLSLVDCRF